jgi:hypothetical protein
VAAVAKDLGYAYQTGKDNAVFDYTGHFTSEWVMVARKADYLQKLSTPKGYREAWQSKHKGAMRERDEYWSITPPAFPRFVWTDDHSNLIGVVRGMNKEWD